MKKRNIMVNLRLNEKELAIITNRAKKSGYSREAYIRSLLNGYIPQPMPPPDYHTMIRELHHIGNNLNQIAQKAHVLNVVDAKRYDSTVQMFIDAMTKIEETILLPKKLE